MAFMNTSSDYALDYAATESGNIRNLVRWHTAVFCSDTAKTVAFELTLEDNIINTGLMRIASDDVGLRIMNWSVQNCGLLRWMCWTVFFLWHYSPRWALSSSELRFHNHTHTYTHTVGLLWTRDQPVADASTYTGQHKINTRDKHPCPQRDSNRDPSNQAAADLRRRPRSDWDRLFWNYEHKHKFIALRPNVFIPLKVQGFLQISYSKIKFNYFGNKRQNSSYKFRKSHIITKFSFM
jgi:hypothetical protein